MDPPAAITITTVQETRTAGGSDSESVHSSETMVTYSHVTTGTEAPKEMLPLHTPLASPDQSCASPHKLVLPASGRFRNHSMQCLLFHQEPLQLPAPKGPVLPSFINLSTMSTGMGETEDEKSETNRPRLAYDPAALEDSAKNNEEKNRKTSILLRGSLFIHHITPERPQPLQPISTRITVHDFRHQDNRMTITVEVLPWGGHSFAAPFDYEHPVFEGKVLRFRGDLQGHWTVKEFIWERGGRAFLRVDEEDMDYRATIGFPRACVHMQGPDPEVNRVRNWHADQRMARRHNDHLDKQIFHGPPPPPPLPEGFHCSV
ncbi:hypothetical protein K438DRAFT_1946741 [Mycena galopus ATCC 62051]|nr:hypothetical protein K438DRAFT_1946741 [Mycena galopus ATCC 62051]